MNKVEVFKNRHGLSFQEVLPYLPGLFQLKLPNSNFCEF